ncbi:MAG: 2-oxoglutarate dehydrogenase E1 component [Thermoanaerobaculia bacterium]|nr:2-oxoglutarate dehydrogenase E1 component [Thermoanaerobaculia bacterium]
METPTHDELVLDAFRRWGYLAADLDPLGRLQPETLPDLEFEGEAAERGRQIYCGSIGVEFMHIPDPAIRRWVQQRMEAEAEPVDSRRVLELLVRGEHFEQFLQSRYLGNKRFSIEGVVALLPLLDAILIDASARGTERMMLAMSHRGRLSAMANIVGTPARDLFAGFEDVDPKSVLGGGDVKYHMGATGFYDTGEGREVKIHLASNPSHLDAVDPVVMGRVRAKQQRQPDEPRLRVLPVMVHGDSAFAGQGILAETLNLADLEGYEVGGTIHVVANNWIGFTTEPKAYSSTRFGTDVAKRLPSPIFHVNGEDPDAVVRVARMASEYRAEFATDVVVDLIGYRRHGHSEIDDPTLTQPLLYAKIREMPSLWESYAKTSGADPEWVKTFTSKVQEDLDEAQQQGASLEKKPALSNLPAYWQEYKGGLYDPSMEVDTGVPAERLAQLGEVIVKTPEGFHVHPKAEKLLEQRLEMARGERPIDFGAAEALAFASLLDEGTPIRLTGQDTRRGTFNHRHSVLIDTETVAEHTPLIAAAKGDAYFEVYDSPLSEASCLAYEYGFSRDYPEALVLWEAQFGDFVNGAQVPIDQFLAAGEDKWGLLSGLVLLLPHGYEGQGPEHSSARLERFLQLAAEDNMQICQPSTAGQYFHLLRRQALRSWRKPLIVMTPKSMLRHKAATSELAELAQPRFHEIVDDPGVENCQRVLFCSGKIVHDLRAEREKRGVTDTAIIAIDQLYPFPRASLSGVFDRYAEARKLLWVQDEPANQGALSYIRPLLEQVSGGRPLRTIKRRESASPATGSPKAHAFEQAALLQLAFEA